MYISATPLLFYVALIQLQFFYVSPASGLDLPVNVGRRDGHNHHHHAPLLELNETEVTLYHAPTPPSYYTIDWEDEGYEKRHGGLMIAHGLLMSLAFFVALPMGAFDFVKLGTFFSHNYRHRSTVCETCSTLGGDFFILSPLRTGLCYKWALSQVNAKHVGVPNFCQLSLFIYFLIGYLQVSRFDYFYLFVSFSDRFRLPPKQALFMVRKDI
jgi:hypothetical protein